MAFKFIKIYQIFQIVKENYFRLISINDSNSIKLDDFSYVTERNSSFMQINQYYWLIMMCILKFDIWKKEFPSSVSMEGGNSIFRGNGRQKCCIPWKFWKWNSISKKFRGLRNTEILYSVSAEDKIHFSLEDRILFPRKTETEDGIPTKEDAP